LAEASRVSIGARRFGYAVAVGINVLVFVVVNNILSWGWLPWLTPEFEKLLPVINLALVVNIVLNLLYMAYDEPPVKAATQIVVNLLAIAVLVWTLQVYPFDFSAYDFPIVISDFDLTWDLVAPHLGSRGSPGHRSGHRWDGDRRCHRDGEAIPSFGPHITALMGGSKVAVV